jgi:hypothetical protein
MKLVRVNAPFVNLKVRDANGAWVVQGMYEGGTVPKDNVDPDSLAHHLETEFQLRDGKAVTMVEVIDGPAPQPQPKADAPMDVMVVEPKAEEPKKAAAAKKNGA